MSVLAIKRLRRLWRTIRLYETSRKQLIHYDILLIVYPSDLLTRNVGLTIKTGHRAHKRILDIG